METLSFAPVTSLVAALRGAGVRADTNPEDVNLPGAWVTVDSIIELALDGHLQLECSVYLITADGDYARAYGQLAELYNLMLQTVRPDGPVTPQGVVMPGNSTPMPALRVPVNLI